MSLRPHGHARVNARSPEAFGKCDGCGFLFNLVDLRYQHEWAGPKLINRRLRKCSSCMDQPQPQLRERRLTQDPVPVRDPRPLNNLAVMGGYAVMQRTASITTIGGDAGPDAGIDASHVMQNVSLGLQLEVIPPDQDTGYILPPFRDLVFDNSSDAGPDAGIGEYPGIPIAIDPT